MMAMVLLGLLIPGIPTPEVLVALMVVVAVVALGVKQMGMTLVRQAQMPVQVVVVAAKARVVQVMVPMGQLVLFFLFIREVPSQDYPEVKVAAVVAVAVLLKALAARQVRR
jgi:hypothetical protein